MENTSNPNNIYKNFKIYKITDNAYTEQYIGSTVQALSSRMTKHRQNYNEYRKLYNRFYSSFILFDTYGIDNCKIELVEFYPCESKEELRRREGHWIKTETCVNKRISGRTDKEYRDAHKDKYKTYLLDYRQKNKERKAATDKDYALRNKAKISEYKKQYYQQNKERISEHRNIKHVCEICSGRYSLSSKTAHERTQKHKKALNQEPEPEN